MSPVIPGLMATAIVWRFLLTAALLGTLTSTIFLFMVFAAALRYRKVARAARTRLPHGFQFLLFLG